MYYVGTTKVYELGSRINNCDTHKNFLDAKKAAKKEAILTNGIPVVYTCTCGKNNKAVIKNIVW